MSKLTCPVCGNQHDELPTFSFEGPTFWKAASAEEKARDFELGPDLCRYKDKTKPEEEPTKPAPARRGAGAARRGI